ncbi:MAG: helix-turn-helix domain-containing protein [Chloroflexi bacterium]|nr:helix-turn-helix domain-containing protein [Chloroflexota bacterium]
MVDDWITTQEASKISGYHPESIRALIRQGRIKGRKFLIVWQVSRSSLLAYLREQAKRGDKRGRKPLTN